MKFTKLAVMAGVFSALALAESWTGTLVDAACASQNKAAAKCAPSGSTTTFALITTDGKTLTLDDAGNAKAAAALKNNADRAKTPGAATAVSAKVTGTASGDKVQVESIELQ